MMGLGFGELVLIFLIVLVIFGAGKLPQIGDALGRSIRNFKKASTADNEIDVTPKHTPLPPAAARDGEAAARTEEPVRKGN